MMLYKYYILNNPQFKIFALTVGHGAEWSETSIVSYIFIVVL